MEYLVRWRGYGSEGDTWEPESHLSTCMIYVHDFNRQHAERQRDATLLRSTRSSPSMLCGSAHRPPHRPQLPARGDISGGGDGRTPGCVLKPALSPALQLGLGGPAPAASQQPLQAGGPGSRMMSASPVGAARRGLDLSKTGIKILVPKSPMNSRPDSEESPSEAALSLEASAQEASAQEAVPPEVALLEKPAGVQLGPGEERARMGTRPRSLTLPAPPQVPITPAAMRSLGATGEVKGHRR